MAATVTITDKVKVANARINVASVLLDSSYPTGGEAITPNQFGMGVIMAVLPVSSSGFHPEWDNVNNKLLMYWVDNNAVADSQMIQVPDTTDLSAVTVIVTVIGR